jgi:hypothetical protein
LTPDDYVAEAKELYDARGEADECPPYMVIYETLHNKCKEQRDIVDNGVDVLGLSTLGALPRLTHICLSFLDMIYDEDEVLSSFGLVMTTGEDSYKYHVQVVSDALESARNRGVAINTISLSDFVLPYHFPWEVPNQTTLSESLRKLVAPVQVLRLVRSNSALELLSHYALDLHQLDMCNVETAYSALEDFLQTNKESICSIGFHKVRTSSPGQLDCHSSKLSSGIL